MKKFLCIFKHKFLIKRKIKGVIKGTVDTMRGVFIIYECERCNKQKAEFISIADRKVVMPEYAQAEE
jgi:hypothetical protein